MGVLDYLFAPKMVVLDRQIIKNYRIGYRIILSIHEVFSAG